jgi:hypothetical protein
MKHATVTRAMLWKARGAGNLRFDRKSTVSFVNPRIKSKSFQELTAEECSGQLTLEVRAATVTKEM